MTPSAITSHQSTGLLELRWPDGLVHRLPHGLLRARCRCGGCEQRYRLGGAYPEVDTGLRLTAIEPIADKALNLHFSDGHGRGIYPWDYLRQLGLELDPPVH